MIWISIILALEILWFHWAPIIKAHLVRAILICSVLTPIIHLWVETTTLLHIIYQVIMFHKVVLVLIVEHKTGNQMKLWQIVKCATINSMCWEGSIIVDSVEMWHAIPVAMWKNMYLVIKTSKLEFAYNVTKKTSNLRVQWRRQNKI